MRRCDRNRKRSKRRSIFCPIHGCHLDSVSPKYPLFADQLEQMRERGFSRKNAMLLLNQQSSIVLQGEWLEEFWCPDCQSKHWYHVQHRDGFYTVKLAPQNLWQHACGVIDPNGNPSVGEFTRNAARRNDYGSGAKKSMRWAG